MENKESKIQEVLDVMIYPFFSEHHTASPENIAMHSGIQGLSIQEAEEILNTLVQRGRMVKNSENRYCIVTNGLNWNRLTEIKSKKCYEDKTKNNVYPLTCKGCNIIPQCNRTNNVNQPVSG